MQNIQHVGGLGREWDGAAAEEEEAANIISVETGTVLVVPRPSVGRGQAGAGGRRTAMDCRM